MHDPGVAAFAKNAGESSQPAFLANAATRACRRITHGDIVRWPPRLDRPRVAIRARGRYTVLHDRHHAHPVRRRARRPPRRRATAAPRLRRAEEIGRPEAGPGEARP